MNWTFEEISRECLGDSRIAVPPAVAVEAFVRVERVMGRRWIENCRTGAGGGRIWGAWPTLRVVTLGQELASVEGAAGAEQLIERLQRGDPSAHAELTAIHMLRSRRQFSVELYPKIMLRGTEHEPDFRIRHRDEPWTYVEVASPDKSQEAERAGEVFRRLADLVRGIRASFALEVFLRRMPTDDEVDAITRRIPQFSSLSGVQREDLGDLGMLILNQSPPGQIVLQSHPGEDDRPRLGHAFGIGGTDEPPRHIAVRMAFSDERAEEFFRRESRQLPADDPGLIMIMATNAPSALTSWEAVIRRRFQPTIHTRVSAVCLFMPGVFSTPEGEADVVQARVLTNPHGRLPLPPTLAEVLREIEEESRRFSQGPTN